MMLMLVCLQSVTSCFVIRIDGLRWLMAVLRRYADFKNVSIVAHYIKERTRNAQFIIISLRSNMFELADRLVGIYKTDNATKSVAIDPHAFVVAPPPAAPTGNVLQPAAQPIAAS